MLYSGYERRNSCGDPMVCFPLTRILLERLPERLLRALGPALVAPRPRLGSCDFTAPQSCDFTAHMCTGIKLSIYKLFVNPLFNLISVEHVIIGSKTQWKTEKK